MKANLQTDLAALLERWQTRSDELVAAARRTTDDEQAIMWWRYFSRADERIGCRRELSELLARHKQLTPPPEVAEKALDAKP